MQEDFQRAFQTQIGDFMTSAESTPVQLYKASSLAGVMEELGYSCTSSEVAFKNVLNSVGLIDEKAVAEVLGMVARTHSGLDDPSGTQASLAAALGAATLNDSTVLETWKMEVIVDVLKSTVPRLDWVKVAENLDHEGFMIPDQKGFVLIVAAYRRATDQPFPLSAVLGRLWSNSAGQLSFLRYAVSAPPEAFSFEHCTHKQTLMEGLHAGKPAYGTPNHAWLCLDLLETLCRLAEAGFFSSVRQLLEYPMKNCPEVLLLGIAAVQSQWGILQKEVCDALVPQYVLSHPNSSVVLHRLWPLNKDCVLRAMVAVYDKDPTSISRILDVCQEIKALTFVLDLTPYPFCVELAALASRREYLNLEKWVRDRISADGATFIEATLKFLNGKLKEQQFQTVDSLQLTPMVGKINLSVETLAIFLRVLQTHTPSLPPELLQAFKEFQERSYAVFPQLQSVADQSAESFASDVEEEANAFFQNIYNGQMSVDEAIQLLRRLKASQDQREQVVFACMIHSLFDEYQFFPQYPDKELKVTAVLFGGLIHNDFLSSISLGVALRYILDALRKPTVSKMFSFGCTALQQFKSGLLQWPQYCQQVLQIPHLKEADPALYQHVENIVKEEDPTQGNGVTPQVSQLQQEPVPDDVVQLLQSIGSNQPSELLDKDAYDGSSATPEPSSTASPEPVGGSTSVVPGANGVLASPEAASERPSSEAASTPEPSPQPKPAEFTPQKQGTTVLPATTATSVAPGLHFSVINAETLEVASQDVDFAVPTELVVDKVHFLVNNLASNNVEAKSKELCKLIGEDYWPWLANYMVVKRAAQEANFHSLYIELIDRINEKKLTELMVKTTYKYVKVLLKSERIKVHTSERSLLKNLGSWLGQLTVKKNKPVLQKDLDLKGLVFQAYEQGKMIAVIPFVHKVLESCAKSKIFKPPNPWLMALLSLLAEIYALDKLKLNLKFEIEMLFKDLELPLPDIKPSESLGAYKREMVNNPDFSLPVAPPRPEPVPAVVLPETSQPPALIPILPAARVPAADAEPKRGPTPTVEQPNLAGPTVAQQEGLFNNIHAYIQVNPQYAAHADKLKRILPVAIDRAICDIINPVVDRSVTIACCTAKELISKDFALEPDEQRMRKAAHLMVSSLAGSLALVTCKEPLRLSLSNQLRQLLQQVLPADQNFLEQTVQTLTNDNLDLGCTIIEKAATDKAIREIDERLLAAYQARAKAKASNQPFADVNFLSTRIPNLPESLRPNPYQQNPQQQRVYDEFARIPRTPTPSVRPFAQQTPMPQEAAIVRDMAEIQRLLPNEPVQVAGMVFEKCMVWLQNVDIVASKDPSVLYAQLPESSEIHQVVNSVVDIAKLATNQEQAATGLAKKIFSKIMIAGLSRLLLTTLVAALDVLRIALAPKLPFDVTAWLCAEDETKLQKDVGEALIRSRLLHMPDFDAVLAKYISTSRITATTEFAVHIIQSCVVGDPILSGTDLYNTLDVLSRIAMRANNGQALMQLVESARAVSRLRPGSKLGTRGAAPGAVKQTADPPGLREQTVSLFDEWARLIDENPTDKVQAAFVNQLQQAIFSKGDDITERFLRIVVELSANHCLNSENSASMAHRQQGSLSFVALDAFARLVLCLINSHGAGVNLLHKVLVVVVQVLQRDAEERAGAFNARPYFRIFIGLISDLSPTDPTDATGFNMLLTLGSGLQILQPMRVPGFAFAWLELIAHRSFMPKLLMAPGHKGWPQFQRLLVALLRFLEPYLRNADLTEAVRLLYKGTLRVLLVLLHDFPEFLCEYHFQLCDVVPPSCIQMRNLILSAFPRNMRLPDPFTPNLKVDLLPEISQSPRFLPDPEFLLSKPLKGEMDQYMKTRQPVAFLVSMKQRLLLQQHEVVVCGTRYNVPVLNSLVFYVGIQAIQQLQQSKPGGSPVLHGPAMDIFQRLASELDTEGRYLFLNAIANQLRYPNSHTHYFSCVLLYLFAEAQQEIIQEQITRVLLERLIVNRPHPWGLLITFIELIKNPRYNFWSHSFVRCAPEIERLFESVARSCMGPQPKPEDDIVMPQNEAVRG